MAIIDKVEITISSGGSVLHEYDVDPDDHQALRNDDGSPSHARKSVKYIEATPGANFQIHYSINEGQPASTAIYFAFRTYIDGQRILSPLITTAEYKVEKTFADISTGSQSVHGANWKVAPFYWKELLTVDEKPTDTVAEMLARYASIGTIQVNFLRNGYPKSITQERTISRVAGEAIPEKALKGQPIELATGLQEEKQAPSFDGVWDGDSIDGSPYSTFVFLSRSKTALQIFGALPRSPTPEPLEERDPETLTREELIVLARRRQAQREVEKVKIKRESREENHQGPVVKQNAQSEDDEELSVFSLPKKRIRLDMETIDLTED